MNWQGWAAILGPLGAILIAWIGARYGLLGQKATVSVQESAQAAIARNDDNRIILDYARRLEDRIGALEDHSTDVSLWWETDHDPWDDDIAHELEAANPGALSRLRPRTPLPRPRRVRPVQMPPELGGDGP